MATINAFPSSSLMDERVAISVAGLPPRCPVTIRSHVTEITKQFQAWAQFLADENGRIFLDKNPSIGGTYTGVEPMGLFWSLQPCPGQRYGIRFSKKHPQKPVVVVLSLHRGHLADEAQLATDEPLHVAVVHKWYMREAEVDRVRLTGHEVIRGVIYKPKGPGPFPGVLDMFGTAGGLMEFRAALLASHGYASYALPIYAYEDLPESMLNVDFEYFEAALNWFISQPFVQPAGIGIVASSLGGSIALQMAARFPQVIAATVCVSCPPFMPNVTLNYRGKALPFVWFDTEKTIFDDQGVLHPLTGWPAPQDIKDEELIEIEKITGHILFIGGSADECVPIPEYTADAIRRRGLIGRSNHQTIIYEGAGHIIEPPYAPVCTYAYVNVMDIVMALGGKLREHAYAQEDAWSKILQFLQTHLGRNVNNTGHRQPQKPTRPKL